MFRRATRIGQSLLLALAAGAAATAGCGGDAIRTEGTHEERPKWVDQGASAFKDKAFYGVGVAADITSISLRRTTADAKARTELAKLFSSRVQNLIKNYDASTADGDRESAEAHHQEASKLFTEMELTGVDIVARYFDMTQNAQYSLARLDPEAFEAQLDRLDKLSKRTRQIIRENAQRAFEEIDAESARLKGEE